MPRTSAAAGGAGGSRGEGSPTARRGSFEALGDPVRRRLVELLAAGEQPAGALVDALQAEAGISQPAVSQHLRVLRDARLVTVRAEGTRRLYAVDAAGLDVVRLWLARFADPFAQPLDALKTELARGRRARRRGTSPREEDAADRAG
ncbi:ArsR/SmtB family transcription factor [Krasilnikoviella flava]|uniref:DNA-binding transcriptional regulator, ArsR family n=1 Tax=Krasilnikoviella flava TaxID=526729 RepID=A0A1T5M4D3_9MICO|nr:metalloregulator ArsR/SmtB family transcription factor [Krasilnikoviella flava]SKC82719.1 DNA-binding transcriptional regulator, ArsR family [Krasilnikoviella flava]